jgi:hypothetical protein
MTAEPDGRHDPDDWGPILAVIVLAAVALFIIAAAIAVVVTV